MRIFPTKKYTPINSGGQSPIPKIQAITDMDTGVKAVEYIIRTGKRYPGIDCSITVGLGIKGKKGILESMKSREAFLMDESHRIRFVYTPKHSSWVGQIEIWFGIINRKLLKKKQL